MTRTLSPEGAKPGELTSVDWYDELGIGWNEIFDQDPAAGVVGKVPGAAAAAVARDPPPRPPGGPERGAARSERKEARAPGRPAAAAAPGDGGAAPVPVPTMGERNRPKAKSKPGEAISFEVATSKIPPLYLRIGGGTKNAIERGMKERLLTCAATQARKPAEVMEIELDQLRAELGQAHRDKRKEAQQLRRLARRCRVKPGEDLEALEERYLAGRPLPPLTLAELLTPRCQPTESGETSARRGESKAFFMQLGRLPASDAPSSKDLWCTGSAGCACCSLPLLARARHGELSTPRALPLQP